MKPRAQTPEPLFDPILDELYRARDADARKFNFDPAAICDALARPAKHNPASTKPDQPSLKKAAPRRAASHPGADIEEFRSTESLRRLKEIESGSVTGIPVEESIARAKASLRCGNGAV